MRLTLIPELFQGLARQSVEQTMISPVQTSMRENNSFKAPFKSPLNETTNEPIYASIEELQTATDSLNDSKLDFSNYPNSEAKKIVSESTNYSEMVFADSADAKQEASEPIYAKVDLSKKMKSRGAAKWKVIPMTMPETESTLVTSGLEHLKLYSFADEIF